MAMKAVKYKAEDFRLIQQMALAPMAIVARKDFPAKNANEMVAYIQKMAKEGSLSITRALAMEASTI